MKPGEWVAVDLDGTLAVYDGWKGEGHIGAPIAPMVERVRAWLEDGHDVRIFTARVTEVPGRDLDRVRVRIESWCREHIGRELPVTNVKDFGMAELFDDRAVSVEANTGRLLAPSRRLLREPVTP